MEIGILQKMKAETDLPICFGSPLIGKKESFIPDKFGIEITHKYMNPQMKKENYQPENIIKVGIILHILGTHEQIDSLMGNAF